MEPKKLARDILSSVGGKKNIAQVEKCSTRLRFNLVDETQTDIKALEQLPDVLKVINKGQFQIVIGDKIVEVYDALMDVMGSLEVATTKSNQSWGNRFLQFIIAVFQPLVPAIAGAGVLKSILLLLSVTHVVSAEAPLYVILAAISDATFYFLPLMVAVTTATALKSNRMVAMAAVGVLLLPAITTAITEGMSIFGLTIQSIAYNNQVFPAILAVIFLSFLERGLNKITPAAIRIFFVPLVALAITVPITLLFLGPLGYQMGQVLTTLILWVYARVGFLALALLAGILPFMIAIGMHKALIPYATSMISDLGYESLYLPASLAHNISESGACFGVALKTKDKTLRSTAFSAGVSALMGITEPALYGVTLQNKKVLGSVVISGTITGGFLGLLMVKGFALVGPGLASITMFMDVDNGMNFWYAVMGLVLALLVSFVLSFIMWQDDIQIQKEEVLAVPTEDKMVIDSPLTGEVVDIRETQDTMFAERLIGDGVAIIPENGELRAPTAGTVMMVFETKHALGLQTETGFDLLFHIGLDTVQMNGAGFEVFVEEGQAVQAGDLLLTFNLDLIREHGYDVITPVLVTNISGYHITKPHYGYTKTGQFLFAIERVSVDR